MQKMWLKIEKGSGKGQSQANQTLLKVNFKALKWLSL